MIYILFIIELFIEYNKIKIKKIKQNFHNTLIILRLFFTKILYDFLFFIIIYRSINLYYRIISYAIQRERERRRRKGEGERKYFQIYHFEYGLKMQ